MATLNRAETNVLRNAMIVMDATSRAIREGKATANHAEHLEAAKKQVNTVVTMKGHYDK